MAWYGESRRHALAAKGIKTGHRFRSRQHMTVRNMTDMQKAEPAILKKDYYMGRRYRIYGRPFSREVFAQLRKKNCLEYHDAIACENEDCFCEDYGWRLYVNEDSAPILRAAGYTIGTKEEYEAYKEAKKMAESAKSEM